MNRVRFNSTIEENAEIRVPAEGDIELYIEPGQKIRKGETIYKIRERELKESYYLPKVLGISPESSRDYIGRVSGEYVMKGDLLAEKLASAGLVAKKIVADCDGIVSLNRLDKGFLDIVGEFEHKSIEAKFDGIVEEISLNSFIRFRVRAGVMPYTIAKNISSTHIDMLGEASGELTLLGDGKSVFNMKDLDESYTDKIVFVGRHLNHDLAVELFKRGAVVLITYSMDYYDFKEIKIPVIVLVGFGQLRLNPDIVQYFKDNVGMRIKVDTDKKTLLFIGGNGVDTNSYKGQKYFAPALTEGDKVFIRDGERYGTTGIVSTLGEKHLEEEGFISITTHEGIRTIVKASSLELLPLY